MVLGFVFFVGVEGVVGDNLLVERILLRLG